jgi:hypothetical protein
MYKVATFLKIIVLPNSKLKSIASIVGSHANKVSCEKSGKYQSQTKIISKFWANLSGRLPIQAWTV